MGLSFLQPLAFLGLLAMAVPVLIHLMQRRREVTLVIPTVRFILEAHRRTARRLKVRRWLLLLARILMVAVLTLILARPVLVRREALVNAARPVSAVIILDTSPSMEYARGGTTCWAEAKRLAGELAAALTATGEAALLVTDGAPGLGFARDPGGIRRYLERAVVSVKPADLAGSLNAAYRLLEGAAFPARQIILISDLARPEWSALRPESLARPDLGVPIRLLDVSGGVPGWNRAITAVDLSAANEGVGRVKVVLEGYGDVPPGTVTLRLDLDDKVMSRRVVEATGPGQRSLEFPLPNMESGLHRLAAVLDADPLPFDDRYAAVIDYGGQIKALTVDGAPGASLMSSETYFLRTALAPERLDEEQRVDNTVVLPGQFPGESLDRYRVVILANVRSLEQRTVHALAGWVERGGGLVIFLGDTYDATAYRASFDAPGEDLLPAWLGDPAEPPGKGSLAFVDRESPPLDVFRSAGSGDFARAVFKRYVPPGAGGLKPGARALLAFDAAGSQPFLVARPKGKGRVLLFTSSAGLEWNNLATQTVYLPLLQRSVEYLSGRRGLLMSPGFTAGEAAGLDLEGNPGRASLPVTTPGGSSAEARVEPGAGGLFRAVLRETGQAGCYLFQAGDREVPVAVNITRAESDVRQVPAETLAALGKTLPLERVTPSPEGFARAGLRGTIDPTPWLAAVLLLLLLAEGIISVGLRRRTSTTSSSPF